MLKPSGKDYIWGGTRLRDDFNKELDLEPLAETWECSVHPDGLSVAAGGPFDGKTLAEVLRDHPEYLGSHPREQGNGKFPGELPVLIKLIDAKEDLSIQVHPDDAYAREHENGQPGKTEMWYVLDAAPGAEVVFGFLRDMEKDQVRASIADGSILKCLQRVPAAKDDVFYIPAGTVHAIGAGILIAEIQENSNLTYRLYDYGRLDKNGEKRELHIEKALDAAELRGSPAPRQPLRVLRYRQGCAAELLCRCRYFEVNRMLVNTERCRELASFRSDPLSFRVLLCTDGCGSVFYGEDSFAFFRGDCIFVPAGSVRMRIHGRAQFLDVRC